MPREKKKHVKDFKEQNAINFLIHTHSMGWIRDKVDFDNAKYHSNHTINFAIDLLLNIKGTNKEKLEFLEKTSKVLKEFEIKRKS